MPEYDENDPNSLISTCVNQLKSVNLPDVISIGDYAFSYCENLNSVIAPNLQTIGVSAFSGTALSSVDFPNVTVIEDWGLHCDGLRKVSLTADASIVLGESPFGWTGDSENIELVLHCNKADEINGTIWNNYAFKSVSTPHIEEPIYQDNGDGTHDYLYPCCDLVAIDDESHSTTADGDKAATCTSKAYCSLCESEYGETDNTNHDTSLEFDDNGFCPNGCYEPATLVTAENYASLGLIADYVDYYAIANAGQLMWYSSNNGGKNVVLVNDIQFATADEPLNNWNAIRMGNIFDGRNHTVTLYVVYDSYTSGVEESRAVSLLSSSGKTVKNLVLDGFIK